MLLPPRRFHPDTTTPQTNDRCNDKPGWEPQVGGQTIIASGLALALADIDQHRSGLPPADEVAYRPADANNRGPTPLGIRLARPPAAAIVGVRSGDCKDFSGDLLLAPRHDVG